MFTCVWGQIDCFNGFTVELVGFWVARGIVQHPKNFKRQSITGKRLSDIRDKASMETVQKKVLAVYFFMFVVQLKG